MKVIQFKDVWEMYNIKFTVDGKTTWENFWALKGINFELENSETLGIIGENGAGKSTVLKLIAGMINPDRGEVSVSGRVSGLLELGAGFQTELTGRDNIYLNASLFGLNKAQIEAVYEEIVNFASIGKFINAPVKCYSQGMFVRLAFAIAIHVNPDILLIDDTLAVGDEYFQRRCINKIFELKEQGKTIVFVTHDMQMLSRLCKRALFLKEGRIVKDDLTDKVIPLYSQTVGERRGVGVLQRNEMSLVFNNGRFFLNWQDNLLTPGSGAHASFLINNKWYNSQQADWEVTREENKITATGEFYQLGLKQIWRLELLDGYNIAWDIELDSEAGAEIQEGQATVTLINEYTNWLTPLEKGNFPAIEYKNKNWQLLLDAKSWKNCVGAVSKDVSNKKIPSFIFEQNDYRSDSRLQISNSDYINNCRVLQYKTLYLEDRLAPKEEHPIYFSGKITLDSPDIEGHFRQAYDQFSVSCKRLNLTFDNGECILHYNGVALTKSNHMATSIFANGKWYHSSLAQWEIKKGEENELIAKGNWHNLALTQIWKIRLLGEDSFLWQIDMQVNREIDIEQQYAHFFCSKDYKYWFSDYGTGKFPDEFLKIEMDMMQRCIPDGIIGLLDSDNRLPALSLSFSRELNNFAKIFNSDNYTRARILRVERVEPERNLKFLPGEYRCFEMKIFLGKDKQIRLEEENNRLQEKKLSFIFDKGSGRIYWNGLELTKRLGLYTSLRSQGRWHDSASCALWKIEERNGNRIKAAGRWLNLPIEQYWEVILNDNNLIQFMVKIKVLEGIEVDRLQTNLMLSEKYAQWMMQDENGFFPAFKAKIDDDWDSIRLSEGNHKQIGASGNPKDKESLPSVVFSLQGVNPDWFPNILNSDCYHRGRVLQYLNAKQKIILLGEYPYFSGKIVIKD